MEQKQIRLSRIVADTIQDGACFFWNITRQSSSIGNAVKMPKYKRISTQNRMLSINDPYND